MDVPPASSSLGVAVTGGVIMKDEWGPAAESAGPDRHGPLPTGQSFGAVYAPLWEAAGQRGPRGHPAGAERRTYGWEDADVGGRGEDRQGGFGFDDRVNP